MKTTEAGGPRGYDGGKKVSGRKRHLLVDTLGLVMAIKVHEADIQDRTGAVLLLRDLPNVFPRMGHVWADAGYTGKLASDIKTYLGWVAGDLGAKGCTSKTRGGAERVRGAEAPLGGGADLRLVGKIAADGQGLRGAGGNRREFGL